MKIAGNSPVRLVTGSLAAEGSNQSSPPIRRSQSHGAIEGLPARNAGEAGNLRRSHSAPRRLASELNGKGIPEEIDKRLTALYGPTRPARAKAGKLPVQETEFDPADAHKPEHERRARVNPTRAWVTKTAAGPGMAHEVKIHSQAAMEAGAPPPAGSLLEHLDLEALRRGKVSYKWNVTNNGTLVVGESKPAVPDAGAEGSDAGEKKPRRIKMGHTTLVGGRPVPEARFGGVLRYDAEARKLVIDNDSGRFSEHADLTPEHLANVALLFAEAGLQVSPEWKDMVRAGGSAPKA